MNLSCLPTPFLTFTVSIFLSYGLLLFFIHIDFISCNPSDGIMAYLHTLGFQSPLDIPEGEPFIPNHVEYVSHMLFFLSINMISIRSLIHMRVSLQLPSTDFARFFSLSRIEP